MRKYGGMGLLATGCGMILLITSCVAEFLNPIPPPKDLKPDSTLLGEWEMTEGKSSMRVYVYPRNLVANRRLDRSLTGRGRCPLVRGRFGGPAVLGLSP